MCLSLVVFSCWNFKKVLTSYTCIFLSFYKTNCKENHTFLLNISSKESLQLRACLSLYYRLKVAFHKWNSNCHINSTHPPSLNYYYSDWRTFVENPFNVPSKETMQKQFINITILSFLKIRDPRHVSHVFPCACWTWIRLSFVPTHGCLDEHLIKQILWRWCRGWGRQQWWWQVAVLRILCLTSKKFRQVFYNFLCW